MRKITKNDRPDYSRQTSNPIYRPNTPKGVLLNILAGEFYKGKVTL